MLNKLRSETALFASRFRWRWQSTNTGGRGCVTHRHWIINNVCVFCFPCVILAGVEILWGALVKPLGSEKAKVDRYNIVYPGSYHLLCTQWYCTILFVLSFYKWEYNNFMLSFISTLIVNIKQKERKRGFYKLNTIHIIP